jgi:hypothetical protein
MDMHQINLKKCTMWQHKNVLRTSRRASSITSPGVKFFSQERHISMLMVDGRPGITAWSM